MTAYMLSSGGEGQSCEVAERFTLQLCNPATGSAWFGRLALDDCM